MFRSLLLSWLRQTAQQQVRGRLLEAARNELTRGSAPAAPGSEPAPCDFGVIVALGIEAGGLVDLMKDRLTIRGSGFVARRGELRGRQVVLAESGPGRTAAARAAEAILDAYRPGWLISAGFAGGLDPALRRGDLLIADRLIDTSGAEWTAEPATLPSWLGQVRGVRIGRLLTADRIVRLPREKQDLGRQYRALAVDMESLAVAEVCQRREVRFLAVRVISDAAGDELPPDIQILLEQKTAAARWGAALGSILNRPDSVKDLWKLKENAMAASTRLGEFLAGVVKHF